MKPNVYIPGANVVVGPPSDNSGVHVLPAARNAIAPRYQDKRACRENQEGDSPEEEN